MHTVSYEKKVFIVLGRWYWSLENTEVSIQSNLPEGYLTRKEASHACIRFAVALALPREVTLT